MGIVEKEINARVGSGVFNRANPRRRAVVMAGIIASYAYALSCCAQATPSIQWAPASPHVVVFISPESIGGSVQQQDAVVQGAHLDKEFVGPSHPLRPPLQTEGHDRLRYLCEERVHARTGSDTSAVCSAKQVVGREEVIHNVSGFDSRAPVPAIDAVVLMQVTGKSEALTMEVFGSTLTPSSTIRWNGTALQTTAGHPDDAACRSRRRLASLRAEVPSILVAESGRNEVRVYTPPPGGGLSPPVIVSTKPQFFYRAPWIYYLLLIACALTAAGLGVYHLRSRRYVERTRRRIADDLHDDIGSKVSSLAIFMDYACRKHRLDMQDRKQLQRYALTARQLVRDVRDTIWLTDADQDHLRSLVQRMRDTAQQMTGGQVHLTFDVHRYLKAARSAGGGAEPSQIAAGRHTRSSERIPALPLDTGWRRAVFFLFKEAVHNAVRHAEAKEICIEILWSRSAFTLRVEDDGKGFAVDDAHHGRGLRTLYERASEAGGTLTFESREGYGVLVLFKAPMRLTGWRS